MLILMLMLMLLEVWSGGLDNYVCGVEIIGTMGIIGMRIIEMRIMEMRARVRVRESLE